MVITAMRAVVTRQCVEIQRIYLRIAIEITQCPRLSDRLVEVHRQRRKIAAVDDPIHVCIARYGSSKGARLDGTRFQSV